MCCLIYLWRVQFLFSIQLVRFQIAIYRTLGKETNWEEGGKREKEEFNLTELEEALDRKIH